MTRVPRTRAPWKPCRCRKSRALRFRSTPARFDGAEVIEPGTTQFEAIAPGSVFGDDPLRLAARLRLVRRRRDGRRLRWRPCDECGCEQPCDFGWEVFDGSCGPFLRGLSVFGGVDGFKGPLDRGGANGNFGVNEGLNLARPLGDPWGCGYQIGANFVQSDFSGASVVTADGLSLDAPFRKQYFATAGIFRRAHVPRIPMGRGLRLPARHLLPERQPAANPQRNRLSCSTTPTKSATTAPMAWEATGPRHRRLQTRPDRHVRPLRPPQFRERRRRPNLGRSHRQRRRAAGRRSLGSAGTGLRVGEPDQLHAPQARHAATPPKPANPGA